MGIARGSLCPLQWGIDPAMCLDSVFSSSSTFSGSKMSKSLGTLWPQTLHRLRDSQARFSCSTSLTMFPHSWSGVLVLCYSPHLFHWQCGISTLPVSGLPECPCPVEEWTRDPNPYLCPLFAQHLVSSCSNGSFCLVA